MDSKKDFFQLVNNAVFGKTVENLRKRVDVKLVTHERKLLKMAAQTTYGSNKIVTKDLVVVHRKRQSLFLNRPTYVGMCILDLSKILLYDFHYNYILPAYGSRAKLLFTDTASSTYEIRTEDAYRGFWKDRHLFDNSDYPEESPFFGKSNKKVPGKFTDETAGVPIVEFVGLRSKMYSYAKDIRGGDKKCKGIKKNVVRREVKHRNYREVLFGGLNAP